MTMAHFGPMPHYSRNKMVNYLAVKLNEPLSQDMPTCQICGIFIGNQEANLDIKFKSIIIKVHKICGNLLRTDLNETYGYPYINKGEKEK